MKSREELVRYWRGKLESAARDLRSAPIGWPDYWSAKEKMIDAERKLAELRVRIYEPVSLVRI